MTITPMGDLWIPDVGAVHISGMNIKTAEVRVSEYIKENRFKSAEITLVILNIRHFKIQVIGAVLNPGFVTISSVDRLTDIIRKSGGLHKLADVDNILLSYALSLILISLFSIINPYANLAFTSSATLEGTIS